MLQPATTIKIMNENLDGKVALVTGAAQGMGFSVAQVLAARGATVVLSDANENAVESAAQTLRETGANVLAMPLNVTDKNQVKNTVARVLAECGGLHILINNAGVLRPTAVIDIPEDEWDFVVGVNLKGTFLCSQAALPAMRAAGWGRIVNFSSTAGKNVSTVGGAHYTAAKAGILGFTRHLAREESRHGITVNAVCPGLIDTEMVRATIPQEKVEAYASSYPVPRLGKPEEVAELVAFLASDRAAYITGASLDINGGDLMI